jgi:hypothetical protein
VIQSCLEKIDFILRFVALFADQFANGALAIAITMPGTHAQHLQMENRSLAFSEINNFSPFYFRPLTQIKFLLSLLPIRKDRWL